MLGLAGAACLDRLLRQAGRPDLAQFNADGVPALLAAVSADTVGALVASRRPRHPVGWLLLALGVTESVEIVADGYGSYGLQARPGALPAAGLVALYNPATLAIGATCVGFVLLLTPTVAALAAVALVGQGRGRSAGRVRRVDAAAPGAP